MILVVEDNDRFRKATVEALSSCGYEVRPAASAEEASRILANAGVDLLVTDIWLGSQPAGIALARAVKQRLPHVKIVIVSADGDLLSSEDCQGIADRALRKPFKRNELQECVAALLAQPAQSHRRSSACA